MKRANHLGILAATAMVTFFTGCGDEPKTTSMTKVATAALHGEDSSPVVAAVAGEPVLRETEFRKRLAQMMQAYPQLRGMMQADALPVAMQKRVAEQFASQAVIEKWGQKTGIEQDAEFVQMLADATKEMRRLLIVQLFEKKVLATIEVDEKEVSEEYNTNKARFAKSLGGVRAGGAHFATAEAAKQFLIKVHGKPGALKELEQKEKGATYRDFDAVTEQSFDVP